MTPRERYRRVAGLHMRCLDQGFLATLGEGFLALMYEAIDRTEGATLLVAEHDGQVQGFVTGGVGMGGPRPQYSGRKVMVELMPRRPK